MAEKTESPEIVSDAPVPQKSEINGNITSLTVEELYDKDKFDLSTMEQGDVLALLQYVSNFLLFLPPPGTPVYSFLIFLNGL